MARVGRSVYDRPMSKATVKSKTKSGLHPEVQAYLSDIDLLDQQPTKTKFNNLTLSEYPFDLQLLSASSLYLASRKMYLSLQGTYKPTLCSTMRSLSAHDLFQDQIEYTPSLSEILWFKNCVQDVADPLLQMDSLMHFNEISLYHEQNHRILWRLLPKAPAEQNDFRRYLNFAESLVVTLDLALGDQLGKKNSAAYERMKVIYRSGGEDAWIKKEKATYRNYLLAMMLGTYYGLELINPEDIQGAVDYVLPGQKKMNKDAVKRSLELNELFTRVTNPQWQERYWKQAQAKLKRLQKESNEPALYLPEDPLDFEEEFYIAHRVFEAYGL